MKKIIKFLQPLIVVARKAIWFITQPKRFGSHVVIVYKNDVLLVTTTYWPGYGVPAGGIKKGETPREAALREVQEEVGIHLETITPLNSFIIREDSAVDTVYGFYAHVDSKEFKLDQLEIGSAEWFPLNNLPPLNSGAAKVIELYKSR